MKTWFAVLLLSAAIAAVSVPPAGANVGYELDALQPSRSLPGPPRGIAVDQSNQDIYVAIVSLNPAIGAPGEIDRFNSDLTADGVFTKGGGLYVDVAVNPISHGFFASQIKYDAPSFSIGTPKIESFSSAGSLNGSFLVPDAGSFPPLGTDSNGRVFFVDSDGHAVLIFNSAGVLQQTITCGSCPGGTFGRPLSLALDAADNLYIADLSPSRVVKMTPSGNGSYSFASMIQNGGEAVAVGVDPATSDVFVGNLVGGRNYHIVAYNSAGVQFDDFGVGIFRDPPQEPPREATNLGYQMAVNATTHKLYVGEADKFFIFEKTTIDPPSAAIKPASAVGQVIATLNASANTNGHAAIECEFEYTVDADVGFTSATSVPCAQLPSGLLATNLSVKASTLSPSTTYRYRLTVTSNAGTSTSGAQTFETLPEASPTVTTEPPTSVSQTTATIKGRVNPHGGSASDCRFEFGTSNSYGSSFPCTMLPEPVVTDVTESLNLSALTAGTTYHYRLVVTTNGGTAAGDDVAFTTVPPPPLADPAPEIPVAPPAMPSATAPAPTPPPITSPRPRRCKKGFHRRKVRGKVRCVKRRVRKHRPRR
jgi:hypothetical protein